MSLIPFVQGGHESDILLLTISSNTSNYNVLTSATAAGFSNDGTSPKEIQLNISAEVTGTGTSPAVESGALHATTTLKITVESGALVSGYTGTIQTSAGVAGGAGGDAILLTSGNASSTTVANSGTVGGGRGGGGGPGVGTSAWDDSENNQYVCNTGAQHTYTGNSGAAGTNLGDAGSAGTLHSSVFTSGPNCTTTAVGAAGAAGYAVRNSGSGSLSTTGTFLGTVG